MDVVGAGVANTMCGQRGQEMWIEETLNFANLLLNRFSSKYVFHMNQK